MRSRGYPTRVHEGIEVEDGGRGERVGIGAEFNWYELILYVKESSDTRDWKHENMYERGIDFMGSFQDTSLWSHSELVGRRSMVPL